jgi:pimeloyl-ACP methyl ester carboxylesterase
MPFFDSAGVQIAYEAAGDGPAIVLVHGFASNRKRNWKDVRWFDALTNDGRRVIALDCRGHGESEKPHDPAAYHVDLMAGDVCRLMDEFGVDHADLMGYSMGARIAAALLVRHPERVSCAILAGAGPGIVRERPDAEAIARVLETEDPAALTNPVGRAFRQFAEQSRNDLKALAACMRGLRRTVDAAQLRLVQVPVLIVAGERDDLVGDPRGLADLIPGAQLAIVPGRDHLSTVGDRRYKEAVLQFLHPEKDPAAQG